MVTGRLTVDTGGAAESPAGPFSVEVAAPAGTVFDVIAAPYLGRTPRAMAGKLRVIERGEGMVLAEHYTPVHGGGLTATTLETVTFDRPHRVLLPAVRGPVPYVAEEFTLTERDGSTALQYSGELGTDFGAAGQRWGSRAAKAWEVCGRDSLLSIQAEAERCASPAPGH